MDINLYISKLKRLLENKIFQGLLFIFLAISSYALLYSNVKPEKINVKLLEVSDQTIRSPKTIEDTEKTEQEKQNVLKEVQDEYTLKKEYAQNRVDLLSSIFDSAKEVKSEVDALISTSTKEKEAKVAEGKVKDPITDVEIPSIDEQIDSLKSKLTDDVNKELSSFAYRALLTAREDELQTAKDVTLTTVNHVMSSKISANEVENAKKRAEEELKITSLNSDLKRAAIELARFAIMQNYFFDPEKTEEQRQKAAESVEPVKILQGQIIVEQGQLVDREIYRQLKLTGLLDTENSVQPFVGLALFIALTMGAMYYYFRALDEGKEKYQSQLLIFSIIFLLSMIIMKTLSLFNNNDFIEIGYFFPAAMAAFLIKNLLNERFAVATTIMISVYGSIIFNSGMPNHFNVSIGMYMLLSGLAGVLLLSSKNFRSKILQAGLFLSIINLGVIFSILFIMDAHFTNVEYALYGLAAFVSGIASAVLTIGMLPFFEAGFGILSTMKLIELANPNHPLLRKILTEAPGTYHHSVMVANLAEAACEAIGANGLLARVGCYYHDIGKTKRPQFFIENQMNIENPHDRLPPATSRDIIIAHAVDGGKLLRKYKLPKEIVDIAEQHHGTTLLKYFYHKAVEEGEDVKEEDFRYPGPKAQTKETAIIGIADSVEAAVRSMKQPTPEKIKGLVKNIIKDRLNDNQFVECDVTMKELDLIEKSLCETLNGIFHSRIEYPELSKLDVKKVNSS